MSLEKAVQKEVKPPPICFGIFEVDLQAGELRRQGFKVKLQEQPFQILAMLLERPGEVVTREEIQNRLWPTGTFVDFDRGLNRATNRLREALGDEADSPRFIETLPRRGYPFIAPVEGARTDSAAVRSPEGASRRTVLRSHWLLASASAFSIILLVSIGANVGGVRDRVLSRRAQPRSESLAVLPLQNLSGDSAQEYFADGMTDVLITEIAKISSLRVISRSSIMHYKGTTKPLPVIASELGVAAVVEGAVLRSDGKVRITVQLIQARDDRRLWSEKYERNLGDVLTLQGEVAQAIASQIRIKLTAKEHASLARTRPINPQTFEAYLKAYFFLNKGTERLDKSIEFSIKRFSLTPVTRRLMQVSPSRTSTSVFLGCAHHKRYIP